VREAARFDRRAVSVRAGLLAAIPVAAVLTLGTVGWSAVAGVTMGAGAMLVGIAWRIGIPAHPGRPPLALLATDAAVMSLATFVGAVTGSESWLHLGVLCAGALIAGLLVSLGNRGGVIGTQALIAAVVFGRFSQPAAASAGLAGLVLAGGLAQVLFQGVVRWPAPLPAQRAATAAAYRVLSGLATASWETSTLPAGSALDDAQAGLSSLVLFGDPALLDLRSLVSEGHRMRVALSAIGALMRQQRSGAGPGDGSNDPPREAAEHILVMAATVLELIARAIEGDRSAVTALPARTAELSAQADALIGGGEDSAPALARRLSALAGQLRAAAALASSAGQGGGPRDRRPQRHANRLREGARADLALVRANVSLRSPAGRHALRLAFVVLVAELAARHLPFQRGYWMVVAAATTLRPEFGATFTRGAERALGTCLGVALAGAIAIAVHPAGAVTIVLVGLLAWAGYSVFPASFAFGFAFITALVVFLLNAISPDTLATAWARLLDTLIGGGFGLIVYALWPTWSDVPARQGLADLIDAQRAYLAAILDALTAGRRAEEAQMRTLSRRARLARTTAESTVARSLSEPATRRIDAEESQGTLAALRRLVQAAHVLRLDAQEDRARPPLPALEPLARGLDLVLATVEARLRSSPDERPPAPGLPNLRARYLAFERAVGGDVDEGLLVELDEIVDATGSMAALVGLDLAAEAVPRAGSVP
jgi:uncharacterized membrane protein YccC